MPSDPSAPAPTKRFPTVLVLAPPLLSAGFVGAFRLVMSGRESLDVHSTMFTVIDCAM